MVATIMALSFVGARLLGILEHGTVRTQPEMAELLMPVPDSAVNLLPQISFVPPVLQLTMDSTRWVVSKVKILNRGTAPLQINGVKPSCGCAAATVLSNPVKPMDVGEMLVRINTSSLHDTLNLIEFSIESNAKPSPIVYKTYVRNPNAAKPPVNKN